MLLSEYIQQVRVLIHDVQSVDFTDAEIIAAINAGRDRVALDTHCVRRFLAGLNVVANRETYPIQGGIGGVRLTAAGAGYTSAPAVTIAPPVAAGGTQATAIAAVSAGVVTGITMTEWGSDYAETPAVTFVGGGGAGAAAVAVPLTRVVDILSVTIIWPGNTNAFMLGWRAFTWFQAFCRSYRGWKGYPRLWTNHTEENLFFLFPAPDQAYGCELDVWSLPAPLVLPTENDTQVRQPNADLVQFYGSHIALSKLQNYDQSEYWRKLYEIRLARLQGVKQDRRIRNPYMMQLGRT